MKVYLNSYYPMSITNYGRNACKKYNIHELEDGSIRREPDFTNDFPGISGLCRPGAMNRINLKKADLVIYKTNNTHYLTAILEVIEKLDSHAEAKLWYEEQNIPVPSNCICVERLGIEKSHAKEFIDKVGKSQRLNKRLEAKWDEGYIERALNKSSSYFFVTKSIYNAVKRNLRRDSYINLEGLLRKHYSSIPNTRIAPRKLSSDCYNDIKELIELD